MLLTNIEIKNIKGVHYIDNWAYAEKNIEVENGVLVLKGLELRNAVQNRNIEELTRLLDEGFKDPHGIALRKSIESMQEKNMEFFDLLVERGGAEAEYKAILENWPLNDESYDISQYMKDALKRK